MSADAQTIVAGIDTSTVAGHNLRALLLRLADGDDTGRWQTKDLANLLGLGLSEGPGLGMFRLTPLGREVAELLRPPPWRVCDASGPRMKRRALSVWNGGLCIADCHRDEDANRLAALLTADDLRAAMEYWA